MTAPIHYAAGAFSALIVQGLTPRASLALQTCTALGASIASHVFLDLFKHTHYSVDGPTLFLFLIMETLVMAVILLNIPIHQGITDRFLILVGIFGAAVPDVFSIAILHIFHGSITVINFTSPLQFILAWLFIFGLYKIKPP